MSGRTSPRRAPLGIAAVRAAMLAGLVMVLLLPGAGAGSAGVLPVRALAPPSALGAGPPSAPVASAARDSTAATPPGAATAPIGADGLSTGTTTIDLVKNAVTSGVATPRYANGLVGIAYDPVDHWIFATGALSNSVMAIDPTSGIVFTLPGPLVTGNDSAPDRAPGYVAYDPANGEVYVTEPGFDNVSVYRPTNATSNFSLVTSIPLAPGSDPEGVVVVPSVDRIFVADEGTDDISVINGANNTLFATISITGGPYALAYDPVQQFVYVSLSGTSSVAWFDPVALIPSSSSFPVKNDPYLLTYDPLSDTIWAGTARYITVINSVTQASSFNITIFPASSSLQGITWDSGLDLMAVSNYPAGSITMFDESGTASAAIATGGVPSLSIYDSSLGELDVLDAGSNALLRVPDSSQTVSARYDLGVDAVGSAFNPILDRIDVADNTSGRIVELDAKAAALGDPSVARIIPVPGHPQSIAFDPVAAALVVISNPGYVVWVNASTGQVIGTANLGATVTVRGVLYTSDRVFVSGGASTVWMYDAGTFALVSAIATPANAQPRQMAYDSANHLVYVALGNRNTIGYINLTTGLFRGEIPVGHSPFGIAFDPMLNVLFVSDRGDDNVRILYGSNGTTAATLATGHLPGWMTYVSTIDRVLVTETRSNAVAVVDANMFNVESTVPVGDDPTGISFSNVTGDVFVSDSPDSAVVVIPSAPPAGAPFQVSATVSPTLTDADAQVTVTVHPSYPTWAFSYAYQNLPPGCTSRNTSVFSCIPGIVGTNLTIRAAVTSEAGDTAYQNATFSTDPDVTVTSVTPSPPKLTIGTSTVIHVVAADGLPPYTYDYTTLPPGCSPSSTDALTCHPTQIGDYPIELTVIDSAHYPATASSMVVVNEFPIVSAKLSSNGTTLGSPISIEVNASGGTAPFSYAYTGLPAGCASANLSTLTCIPTQAGTFFVEVLVTDASGVVLKQPITISINAPVSGSVGLSTTWVVIGVVVAVVVVVTAVLALRARRKPEAPEAEEGATPEPEVPLYGGEAPNIPTSVVESVRPRGPVEEPKEPRYYTGEVKEAAAPAAGSEGTARPTLTCKSCGTVNEPWLTNCRWCKRPLQST